MASNPLPAVPSPAEGGLLVGHWPHLRGKDSTARIMWSVAACLAPAAAASGYFFGWRAYLMIALAVGTAVAVEAIITRLRLGKTPVADGSAVVTGLLVAFCLPAQARWFVPVVASVVAIAIAKQCFGGLGCNIWNPALIGRAFVQVSFSQDMNPSKYPVLEGGHFTADIGTMFQKLPETVQAVTGASPMGLLKRLASQEVAETVDAAGPQVQTALAQALEAARGRIPSMISDELPSLGSMALGNIGGNLGETSAVLLVLGAIYLIAKGWVRWQVPVAYIITVAIGAVALPLVVTTKAAAGETVLATQSHYIWVASFGSAVAGKFVAYHLLGGGLVLGALYMATDMVTTPLSGRGLFIFGLGCGVLTILIRLYGGYPEAVCYSILLMNTVVPHIDRFTQPRIFGHKR